MSKLLDDVRSLMRVRHYSYETEKTYVYWIRQYIFFHKITHPKEMGAAEVEVFPTHLAVEKSVSASTQNQALHALLFLYREVLQTEVTWLDNFKPAKKSDRVPVVLTREEVKTILDRLTGTNWLIGNLLYGSGVRLIEALRLRVKDLDFGFQQIIARDGKGGKDRFTVLPTKLNEPLKEQLRFAEKLHEQDLRRGLGQVEMPFAIGRKLSERADRMALAICFPVEELKQKSAHRRDRKTSRFARQFTKVFQRGGAEKPHSEKCQPAHFTTQLCDASFTGRL